MSSSNVSTQEMLESDDEEGEEWDDWAGDAEEDPEEAQQSQCLFCEEVRSSAASIFSHCAEHHSFDFSKLRRELGLDFYDCLRLINFIRSRVAADKSLAGSCSEVQPSQENLLEILKSEFYVGSSGSGENQSSDNRVASQGLRGSFPWSDDKYLTPFLPNDSLLYTFDEDEECEWEACEFKSDSNMTAAVERGTMSAESSMLDTYNSRLPRDLVVTKLAEDLREWCLETGESPEMTARLSELLPLPVEMSLAEDLLSADEPADDVHDRRVFDRTDGEHVSEDPLVCNDKPRDVNEGTTSSTENVSGAILKKKKSKVTFASVVEKEKLNINRSYFGSYSGFGIHREMLGDKVRTEAYQAALLENPSLMKDAVVMDLGCGTGILSLFAAKAGASKVIAVDGSEKMTAVATQVAKVNGLLDESSGTREQRAGNGAITVVAGMIEELDSVMPIQEHGVDVLVSEWMGYCLLYESMLGSVLYARDKWLRPGGAMLPDTASMYVAGFGKGGTSLSFWENVYGFDMQCVGEEVLYDGTLHPIIDVIPANDVITGSCLIQQFDLLSMKHEDVDFTADFHVKLRPSSGFKNYVSAGKETVEKELSPVTVDGSDQIVWCYGLVVWFDTGFTDRFCKEKSVVLTTSPHKPRTHWAQTLLTFKERIALCPEGFPRNSEVLDKERIGTEELPAHAICGRISIARSFRYRSIDVSLETSALGPGGWKKLEGGKTSSLSFINKPITMTFVSRGLEKCYIFVFFHIPDNGTTRQIFKVCKVSFGLVGDGFSGCRKVYYVCLPKLREVGDFGVRIPLHLCYCCDV